jgi:hypothetical protein
MSTLENKIPASYHHFLSDLVKSEVPKLSLPILPLGCGLDTK